MGLVLSREGSAYLVKASCVFVVSKADWFGWLDILVVGLHILHVRDPCTKIYQKMDILVCFGWFPILSRPLSSGNG